MAESYNLEENRRREHPRFAVNMEAKVLTDLGTHTARTKDLSRGGLCFILPMPLTVGMNFSMQMTLVFDENSFSEPLVIPGKIIWCTPVEEGYQMGAAFVFKDSQTKQYLEMFLNFLANGLDGEDRKEGQQEEGLFEEEEGYSDGEISFSHDGDDSGLFF